MLTLVILIILFIGTYNGYKNGLILGLVQTIGYTISLILAMDYYKALSDLLYLIIPYPSPFTPVKNPYSYYDMDMIFTLDQSYYYLVSFLLILIAGVVISYFISQLLASFTEELFVPFPFDGIGGAIIGFISHYLAIFIILFTLSTIPYDFIQNTLTNSLIGDSMITSSPGLSKKTYNHFILDVYDKEIKNLPEMELKDLKEKVETEENQESNE